MLGFTPQIFLPAIYTGNTLVRVKRYSMCYIATFILGAVKASNFDVCVSCRGDNNVNFFRDLPEGSNRARSPKYRLLLG